MSEYIERKTTVAKIIEQINQSGKYTDYECGMDDACYIISHIPAADVRPVVHGHFLLNETSIFATCDNCQCNVMFVKNIVFRDGKGRFNFCPNCGANLKDGDEE